MKKFICLIAAFMFNAIISFQLFSSDIYSIRPYGGENIQQYDTYQINWDYPDSSDYVNIYLWDGENCQWSTIATNIPAIQSYYNWFVDDLFIGNKFRIKIQSVSYPKTVGFSISYFTIIAPTPIISNIKFEESPNDDSFVLFPNPAESTLFLKTEGITILSINFYNSIGNMIKSIREINANYYQLSTENIPAGEYFIVVKTSNHKIYNRKIIVSK